MNGTPEQKQLLADWPLSVPKDWLRLVNQPQSEAEVQALRRSIPSAA